MDLRADVCFRPAQLWTGCQWKAIEREWFGVSSSVIHDRFQTWTNEGVFEKVLTAMLRYYGRRRHVRWIWQSIDSRNCPAPLGGKGTGKNPTDRAKMGGKIHILVDQRGAPLSIHVTGANQHDKWAVTALVLSILIKRPTTTQHFCADKPTTVGTCTCSSSSKAIFLISSIADGGTSRKKRRGPIGEISGNAASEGN